MPSTLTYPGVYVEEIPSGTRTLTGVATSVTAFFGRTQRGPVSEPVLLTSFSDYERVFGGLWLDSPLSYAVYDFFKNGGSQAVIIRLYHAQTVDDKAALGIGQFTLGKLELRANNPGAWANNLLLAVDYKERTSDLSADVAKTLGVTTADLFNLTVTYYAKSGTVTERFVNLTIKDTARRVDRVLTASSKFVRVAPDATTGKPSLPDAIPTESTTMNGETGTRATAGTALDSAALTTADYVFTSLDKTDTVNLICVPPDTRSGDTSSAVYTAALSYAVARRAVLIVDPPTAWSSKASSDLRISDLGLSGTAARNAAVYYPRLVQADPLRNDLYDEFVPCGAVAGIIARTDAERGVWKAPAGVDAALAGTSSLAVNLTDTDSGFLNPQGINALRTLPVSGQVIWGARTLRGADTLGDEYKYLPVRRLALYLEESIQRGTRWAVFEPNDEPLWAQIRLNMTTFMHGLFQKGAFQGKSPREAYFVKCDKETTTQADIDAGIVNIIVGFAPLKPAEFVVIKFQQMAGQTS
ncbi:MAG: phage tail sheath subtilisin-like domain-containing protein [Polyangia bacterium]